MPRARAPSFGPKGQCNFEFAGVNNAWGLERSENYPDGAAKFPIQDGGMFPNLILSYQAPFSLGLSVPRMYLPTQSQLRSTDIQRLSLLKSSLL